MAVVHTSKIEFTVELLVFLGRSNELGLQNVGDLIAQMTLHFGPFPALSRNLKLSSMRWSWIVSISSAILGALFFALNMRFVHLGGCKVLLWRVRV